jgi:LysR family transcriptional regulator, benzoate and cis,cis-muconate-responsive activator of ben and cat genes
MELRQLRYFLALARTLNFTRAAEAVRVAQPPFSRQISQLEAELSTVLIDRTARPMRLTPAGGGVFRDNAEEILSRLENMKSDTRAIGQNRLRTLRFSVEPSALYGRFSELIRQLRTSNPRLQIRVVEMASDLAIEKVKADDADIAITRLKVRDHDLEQIVLREEPFMVALPLNHQLAKAVPAPVLLSELREETFILFPTDPVAPFRRVLESLFVQQNFDPKETLYTSEMQAALGLVAADCGVSVVPAAVQRMRGDDVRYRALGEPGAVSPIIMTYSRSRETDVVRMVRKLLAKISA